MKKLVILLFILLSGTLLLKAQTPIAEYFFDTDPGVGKGNKLNVVQTGDIYEYSGDISTNNLNVGFHRLYLRYKDTNGRWGLTENNLFFIYSTTPDPRVVNQPLIANFEYFFDTDPGVGKGTTIAVTALNDSVSVIQDISTNGLSAGFHRLYFRTNDKNGKWGLTENRLLYVYNTTPPLPLPSQPQIVAMEYFIDKDPGVGKGIALPAFTKADSVSVVADISTTNLPAGSNTLNIRAKDLLNRWSIYETRQIYVCSNLPVAAFSNDKVCVGSQTSFVDLSTNKNSNTTYSWDFNNDGIYESSTVGNVKYTYPKAGSYTAKLLLTNPDGCNSEIIHTVIIDPLPEIAGTISGSSTVCQGQSSVVYSVPEIPGATSYIWTLPAEATGSSTTNSISVTFGNTVTSGDIFVKGHNDCGDGVASILAITVSSITNATVTTTNVTSVTSSTAISGGTVNYDGCASITARGVCWSTSSDPTILNSKTTDGNGSGIFTSQISGLIQGTTYYLKAYATNANGTVYGEQKSFTTPETGFVLSGKLIYENIAQTPLNNISLSLLNSNNQSVATSTTDASGNFSFPGLSNANYTLRPDIMIPWGGVSAMDITSYKKHIGNIVSLGQLQVKSGDVNKSNSLSTMDLTIIKQRIGAILSAFTVGDWVFDQTEVVINGLSLVQNIKALCFGDANGSYTPSNLKSVSNVFLAGNGEIKLLDNGEFEIPFVLNKPVNKLSSVTLFINYPFELFDLKGINMVANNDDLFYALNDGMIKVVYSTLNCIDLNEGDLLMTIRFGFKKDASPSTIQDKHLEFSGTGEFGDYDDIVLDKVQLSYAASNFTTLINDYKKNEIKIYPNPAHSQLTVTQVEKARITVIDMLGRRILSVDSNSTSVNLDIRNLISGTYTLMVNKNNKISYRKFSVVK